MTGRPPKSREIAFAKILRSFNGHVQIDFSLILELKKVSLQLIIDTRAPIAVAVASPTRNIESVGMLLELQWINIHVALYTFSENAKFVSNKFRMALMYFSMIFEAMHARRHNKLKFAQHKNVVLRHMIQRSTLDSEDFEGKNEQPSEDLRTAEVISRATHFSSIVNGSNKLCSFELPPGYSLLFLGLFMTLFFEKVLSEHHEQVPRKSLQDLKYESKPNTIGQNKPEEQNPIFFF